MIRTLERERRDNSLTRRENRWIITRDTIGVSAIRAMSWTGVLTAELVFRRVRLVRRLTGLKPTRLSVKRQDMPMSRNGR